MKNGSRRDPAKPGIVCLFVFLLTAVSLFSQDANNLTLVTYNIHHAEGMDGQLSLERIARDIEHGDIIGLQEVDRHFGERSRFQDQADELARKLNFYVVFAANLDLAGPSRTDSKSERRQYGTALLSRYPIEFARNHPLPKIGYVNTPSEQRGLLETQVDLEGRKLRVYVTHLSHLSQKQRLLQVKRVQEIIRGARASGPPEGLSQVSESWVLMGDLNFTPESEEYRVLAGEQRRGQAMIQSNGFVDLWPLVNDSQGHTVGINRDRGARIDYIFISPDLVESAESARVDLETRASDHQPLTGVLRRIVGE